MAVTKVSGIREWQLDQRVVFHDARYNKDFHGKIVDIFVDMDDLREGRESFGLNILWDEGKKPSRYEDYTSVVKNLKPATTLPKNNPNVKFKETFNVIKS